MLAFVTGFGGLILPLVASVIGLLTIVDE